MANNSETKVTFKAFNSEFNKALDEMKNKSSTLRSEFKLQEEQLKHNGTETDKLNAKLKYLSQEQLVAKQKIQATQEQLARAKQVFGENSKEADILTRRLLSAQTAEQKLANQITETNTKLKAQETQADKTGNSVDNIGNKMQDAGGKMQAAGQGMAASFGTATVAIGAGLGVAAKKAMDFEAQLDRVGAIADATDAELVALRESALELGASTSKSATEIAQGQEALAALGFTAKEIIGAMPGVISAAEASGSDMAQTAEVMASTLNIFGMEASKATDVADVLAKTANVSAADLTDMQFALKYAGPPAAALGISLEELSASIGIMTNAGMKGEQAGTTLRSGLLALLDPSKENAEMMETMGIQITDASGNFVGLSQLIENMQSSMEGMTDTQKAANLASLVGTEAVSGMLSLMAAGPTEIDKMTAALENSGGASAEAAQKMKDNLKGTLDELSGSFETMQISIGTALAPAISAIANALQSLTDKFNSLSPNTQKFIAIGAALIGILTGVVAVFGFLLMGIGGVVAAIGTIGLPVAAVIAAVMALGAVFAVAYAKIQPFREGVNKVFSAVKDIILKAIGAATTFFKEKLTQIKAFWDTNGAQILKAFSNVFNAIKAVIDFIMPAVLWIIKSIWGNIKGVIDGALNIILGLVKTFAALFTGDWKGVWEGIKQILKGAWELIWNGFQLLFIGRILKGIGSFLAVIKGLFTNGLKNVVSIFKGGISGVKKVFDDGLPGIWKFITKLADDIVKGLKDLPAKLKTMGKDIIDGLVNGIKGAAGKAVKAAKEMAKGVADAVLGFFQIHSPSRLMIAAGGDIDAGLAKGIDKNKDKPKKSAEQVAKETAAAMKKRFKDELDKSKDNYKLGKMDTREYIASLNAVKTVYAKLPEHIRTVDLEIQKAQKIAAEEAKKVAQQKIDNEKAVIDKKKYYGQLSLEEELKRWKNIIAATKKGSEERIDAEKNVFRVKEEIRKRDFEKGKAAIDDLVKYNNISLGQQLDALRDLHGKYKQGSEEWLEIDRKITDTKVAIHAELKNINDDYLKNVQDVNAKLIEEEKKLNDAYDQALKDRTSSLTSFAGLFDEIQPKEGVTGTGLLNNLKGQVDTFKTWQDSLQDLSLRGADATLIEELTSMGPKAQAEITAIANMTDAELAQYTNLWKEKHSLAAAQAEAELAPLKAQTSKQLQDLRAQAAIDLDEYKKLWIQKTNELRSGVEDAFNPVTANMRQIGEDAMKGLMNGLSAMEGPLKKQVDAIAKTVTSAMKSALKIKSPSRVLFEIGQFAGEGLAIGIEKMKGAVAKASKLLAQHSIPQLQLADGSFDTSGQLKSNLEVALATQPMYFTIVSELDGYEVARNQYEYIDGMMTTKYQNDMLTNGVRGDG
jgi:TP901 family phage tail tape measure protein